MAGAAGGAVDGGRRRLRLGPHESGVCMSLDTVFKAYDIRGRTDNGELTPELAEQVGAAFARIASEGTIAVGRDCRESSPVMAEAMIRGIISQGTDVLDLGEVATDTVYYVSGVEQVA